MKKFLFLFFIIAQTINAQQFSIGETHQLHSEILQEDRSYTVYLPEYYEDEKYSDQKYLVLYVLDGERLFLPLAGVVAQLSYGHYPQIPQSIIVAINNTQRSLDLTPTLVTTVPYKSGGSVNFEKFITTELIPQINTNYRTLGYDVLIGHSFGGLFTVNTLLKNPAAFNAYLAIDPSLWWDDELLVKESPTIFKTTSFSNQRLFLASANSLGTTVNPNKQLYAHAEAIVKYRNLLDTTVVKNTLFKQKYYDQEDHGSVVLPAMIDGLKTIFNGYRLDVKLAFDNPVIVEKQYQKFSEELHFEFLPQSFWLDNVADFLIKSGKTSQAHYLYRLNAKNFPDNNYIKSKIID